MISLTASFLGNYELKAQDVSFSQFYANSLYLNPAFAGATKCPRISMNIRDQYPQMQHTFVSSSISFDKYFDALQGGLGFQIYNDKQGGSNNRYNTLNISAMYSNSVNVTRKFSIKTGFQASYIQKSLNTDGLIFSDMIDEMYGAVKPSQEDLSAIDKKIDIFDLSIGAIGFSENYYFGASVHHLTQPPQYFTDNNSSNLLRKYTLHFGTNISISNRNQKKNEITFSPNVLFQQQGKSQQVTFGAYFKKSNIVAGAFLRQNLKLNNDAIIAMLGFSFPKFKVGYSYDFTVSKLKSDNFGTNEISISAELNCEKQKKKKFKTINCPTF